jgi:hypothetical protein
MKFFRTFLSVIVLLSFLITTAFAGGPELKPYGFVKGEMVYATKGVLSFGGANLSAPQLASGVDNAALGFTAQHTRFGLKGGVGEDVKVGGKIELDFYGGRFDANIKPRLRLAYAWIKKNSLELRFGQQWDLFSPNNAKTNNTNGNMWYAGNRGFRRAQIQLHYQMPMDGLNPMLQLSIGETTKEAAATSLVYNSVDSTYKLQSSAQLGADNLSGMPMIQGRLSAKLMDKHVIGAYFVYASYDPDPDADDDEYNTTGFGADFNLAFSKMLALKGEINMGTNLNNANLFNIAGSGKKDDDRKSLGLWFNAIVKPSDKLHAVLGFGMDKNQTDDLAAGSIEQNMVVYGDLIFPFEHGFSIAAELQSITTSIKDGDDNSALIFNVSGKVTF